MFFHVILTDDCNLCCRYCRGKEFEGLIPGVDPLTIDISLPSEISYNLEALFSFLKKDPAACITFYGGEPLLRIDLIREIMNNAPVSRYMIQTNGLLLDELGSTYVNRLETVLVSIDGPEHITDRNRGAGTFSRVIDNILKIRHEGYKGELIARMTITEGNEVYQSVRYLSSNPFCSFSSIHWQIDADFSKSCSIEDFSSWIAGSYIPDIRRLISEWVLIMEQKGRVCRWYPFLQTAEDLLLHQGSKLRCGCGYANYTINTDGHIGPCPVMVGMKDFYIGHISTEDPRTLPEVKLNGTCMTCDILDFCGGRCLYADIVRPWNEDQKIILCGAIRALREGILEALPAISALIEKKKIKMEDFTHTRFNGCEIIP
jgi:uncharacterized protein